MSSSIPRVIALVPMKAHSERVANKNLKILAGRPLCCWIVDSLTRSRGVAKVVVNTDSPEIAGLLRREFDVVIHERPEAICGDEVSMNRIIEHDLERLPDEYFLQTHATNPLLTAATIDRAVHAFFQSLGEHDSLFAVTRHQARFFRDDGQPLNHDPNVLLRTQDLPPIFEENSNLYLFSRASFSAAGARIGLRPLMFETPKLEAFDIDTPADWSIVEAVLGRRA